MVPRNHSRRDNTVGKTASNLVGEGAQQPGTMAGWSRPVDVFPSPDWVNRRLRPHAIGLLCYQAQISAGSAVRIVELPDAVSPAVQVPCIVLVGSEMPWPRQVLRARRRQRAMISGRPMAAKRDSHTSFYPAATYTASEKRVGRQLSDATLEDNCHPICPWPPVSSLRVNATL